MSIIVKINDVDRSKSIQFDSLKITSRLYSESDSCFFTYKKYGSRTYTPAGGDEVGVWDGNTKIFGGTIVSVKKRVEGKLLVYDIDCKDWVDKLDGFLVTETYEDKTVNEIIADIQSKYATAFDITNVACTTNVERIVFDSKPVSKCFNDLADLVDYHWYVNPSKKIYFFAEGVYSSPFDLTDTNGKYIFGSLQLEDDYEQIKNKVNIQGGAISNVQVSNPASIAAYGQHEVLIKDDTLTSEDEATQKANAVLAAYKDPIQKGKFKTLESGLVPGQQINVQSDVRSLNQDFVIQSVSFQARTSTDFEYDVEVMTQRDKTLTEFFQKEIMQPAPTPSFGNEKWNCDVKFSIVNYHKISWGNGTIRMASGITYSIVAGEHEFTGTEIIYFQPTESLTTFQFSTTFGNGVGEDRIALAYCVENPNTSKGAQVIPIGFMGGVQFWGGENIVARTIVADQIGLNALVSNLVTTGEFITLSAQIKNAIIQDAHFTGVLSVGKTEAKCTDPNADQTSANAQPYTWITGAKPPIDADKTSNNPQVIAWLSDSGSFGDMAWEDLVQLSKLGSTIIVGGYIKSSLLTADNIITGTLTGILITGNTIQTATSGKRIKISSSPQNKIEFLDGASVKGYLEIADDGDGGYYLKLGGPGGLLEIGATLGASVMNYASMPWFYGAGKASVGQVYISGSPNYLTKVGLAWSGSGVASFRFDLGTSMAKLKIPVGSNLYE